VTVPRACRVLFLTASDAAGDRAAATTGGDGNVTKPFSPWEVLARRWRDRSLPLLARLRHWLAKRGLRTRLITGLVVLLTLTG
jgi:CheY-like chemotaxis protein